MSKQKLLTEALQQFSASYYEDVTVADIVGAASMAHGLVFHYFQSKRGLYLAVLREAGRLLEAAEQPDTETTPSEQVRQVLIQHFEFMAQNKLMALRLILRGNSADPEAWQIFESQRWARMEWTCSLLALDPKNAAVRQMLRAVVGAADEATVHWLSNDMPFTSAQLAEAIIQMLISAVRSAMVLDPRLDAGHAIASLERRRGRRRSA